MRRHLLLLLSLLVLAGCNALIPEISKSYEEAIQQDIKVDVPEVYEAMQVALSLTDTYQSDPNLINKSTPYYQDVLSHFGKYKMHPLVLKLDKKLKKPGAYGETNTLIRFQALNYSLAEGKLANEKRYNIPFVYSIAPFPLFLFRHNEQLINSFMQETNFSVFYRQHKPHYDSLINRSHELCNYADMAKWLERKFPRTQNEAFLVVFSPLTKGLHNLKEFKSRSGDKKQTIMFVSAPYYESGEWKKLPEQEKSAYASRVVFTEMVHSYVNPDTAPHLAQLEAAMGELRNWKTENVTGGYNSFSLTFNEYMTWAVYTLYAYDTYPADVFERVTESQIIAMIERKGFIKFREFNNELLRLYKQKKPEESVTDLYPEIVKWVQANRIPIHSNAL